MTKNPFLNALLASLYIVLVASLAFYAPKSIDRAPTVLVPIGVLSLFTLSAAVMGFLFFFRPFELYFAGKKKEALVLFLSTVASFAVITIVVFIAQLLINWR